MKPLLRTIALLTLLASSGYGEILIDGRFEDWQGTEAALVDPLGDGAVGGVDFDSLWVTEEYGFLIMRIPFHQELLMQDINYLSILIDRDNNPETGTSIQGMGVDLRWRFGERSGTLFLDSGSQTLTQAEIGVVSAPTVSSSEFEISFDLSSRVDGELLLPPGEIRFAFKQEFEDGDIIPDNGGLLFTIPSGDPGEPTQLPLVGGGMRFVTWNVLFDGLTERPEPFRRILQAIEPEIIIFEEMWETQPEDVTARLNIWLPQENGWNAAKEEGDVVLATPNPILGSWPIPGARATAFLVQPIAFPTDVQLLLIGAHPPCCNNNEARQLEIDAFMSWLREVREGNGPSMIGPHYGIIIAGDMNLVGDSEQLETLVHGTIVNQNEYGPSFHPDFDGTSLTDSFPRHVLRNQVYTWRDDGSSFSPGKLDYIVYSDYLLANVGDFVFDTRSLPAELIEELELFPEDSELASDHLPVVANFEVVITDAPEEAEIHAGSPWMSWDVSPNPTNAGAVIRIELLESFEGRLELFDILGRKVVDLYYGQWNRGMHEVSWNGQDRHGKPVGSGRYFLRLNNKEKSAVSMVTVIR